MNAKSLSVAYAVRRKSKGLGPIPQLKADAELTVNAEVPDIIEENQEPSTPEAPTIQSALERVMAKHRPTFQRLAADES